MAISVGQKVIIHTPFDDEGRVDCCIHKFTSRAILFIREVDEQVFTMWMPRKCMSELRLWSEEKKSDITHFFVDDHRLPMDAEKVDFFSGYRTPVREQVG